MAGIDVDVQVGADEEDFMEGKSKRKDCVNRFYHRRVVPIPDRTDEIKLKATKKKGRGFGGKCKQSSLTSIQHVLAGLRVHSCGVL